jgi:hypothetical protein
MNPEPLLRYWTLHSPEGHIATCELVRTAKGLEVRCDWTGEGAQARVARTAAIEAVTEALDLAESWKASYLEKGWAARTRQNPRRMN